MVCQRRKERKVCQTERRGPDIAKHLARQTSTKEMSYGCNPGHEKGESGGESCSIVG